MLAMVCSLLTMVCSAPSCAEAEEKTEQARAVVRVSVGKKRNL